MQAERTCAVEECGGAVARRGWCQKHYARWRTTGRLDLLTPEDRFWARVDKSDGDGCWLWTGAVQPNGYGRAGFRGAVGFAHRFAYTMLVGPIPEGLVIDHVAERGCSHRNCVNPAHLEAVTTRENLLRGQTVTAANAAKLACPAGHEYDYVDPSGFRRCKRCRSAAVQRSKARKREKAA